MARPSMGMSQSRRVQMKLTPDADVDVNDSSDEDMILRQSVSCGYE